MKKLMLLILIPIAVVLFSVFTLLITLRTNEQEAKKVNNQYEYYLGKEIYGNEVTTLINKVVNQNEKNGIPKDENGYYLDNGENSLKIELKMITVKKIYSMEDFYKNDMNKFLENFSTIKFKCTNIEYHKKTGKISKITIEQLEY